MSETTNTPADVASLPAKLLPCPFCGGKPSLHDCQTDEDSIAWWVKCGSCGAISGESLADSTPDQEFAVTAWNLRALTPAGEGGKAAMLARVLVESQQQCDEDGTMIAVSRQAVDEAVALLQSLATPSQPGSSVQGERAAAERVLGQRARGVIHEWHSKATELGYDGVADLLACVERGEPPIHIAELLARTTPPPAPAAAHIADAGKKVRPEARGVDGQWEVCTHLGMENEYSDWVPCPPQWVESLKRSDSHIVRKKVAK